ncbi:MAG: LD-carboxypeptidase [Candidatus Acidiferrales bacterium]
MFKPLKPLPLRPGDAVRVIAPASPVDAPRLKKGIDELTRLGFDVRHDPRVLAREGYFAGSARERVAELISALRESDTRAVICTRGGYGSNYLLDFLQQDLAKDLSSLNPKILLGYSDLSTLQIFLWQRLHWVTTYGPMMASGFDAGAGNPAGYDAESFIRTVSETRTGWSIALGGEPLAPGTAEGTLLGGCLTLIETTLATPWELDTSNAILLLEDRGMKPWQVDRALMHLKHVGKLARARAIIFGDFPECEAPAGSPSIRDVISRITSELGVPVVWNVPFGHTPRPMLTLPLGVRARLNAKAEPMLEILEPACGA